LSDDAPTGGLGQHAEARTLGINAPLHDWLALNIKDDGAGGPGIAPLPPAALMQRTSGTDNPQYFASHGVTIAAALAKASPKPLPHYSSILDFGVGCGRLARIFKGYSGRYVGVDVDIDLIAWVKAALPWVEAELISPNTRLPFAAGTFEAAISISVFTHMDARHYRFFLNDLARVMKPGGIAMLTLHGERVLQRAEQEDHLREMLALSTAQIAAAHAALTTGGGFHFIQQSHPALRRYRYGTTFVNERFARKACGALFDVVGLTPGAIHDFQDVLVLRRTDEPAPRALLSGWW
jgi:SAM-dependent methyltransferase